MARVEHALQICFAIIAGCCGALLRDAINVVNLAVIAWITAIVAYLFVDRWKWFSLHPLLAYLGMLGAAFWSVYSFFSLGYGEQLSAVALLLVLVQSILLLQRKNRRIYEQLLVFGLLQLIVGAVLNDALAFGVLLIPTTIGMLAAMTLLQAWKPIDRRTSGSIIQVSSATVEWSWNSVRRGLRRSVIAGWIGMAALATLFFYASPRSRGMQPRSSGSTAVGFSSQLTLNHLGTLADNPQIVLRIRLTDPTTKKNYPLVEGAYLRGVVLDSYVRGEDIEAQWQVEYSRLSSQRVPVPPADGIPEISGPRADTVSVDVDMEVAQAAFLFSLAPYFMEPSQRTREIAHVRGRWIMERILDDWDQGQLQPSSYQYMTRAFSNGLSREWLPPAVRDLANLQDGGLAPLTQFNPLELPYTAELAKQLVSELGAMDGKSWSAIASHFASHLRDSNTYQYTRTIDWQSSPNKDPIDEFLQTTRRGHCQYFASALTMLLRSQGIPARIVVGYRMSEFNVLGNYWIVRQQDAHAWVEAFIPDNQLPTALRDASSQRPAGMWYQLDPTPYELRGASGQVGQAMDVANSLWREYVVEMHGGRESSGGIGELGPLSFWERIQATVVRFRAGQFGESTIEYGDLLSWRAGLIAMIVGLVLVGSYLGLRLLWQRLRRKRDARFYVAGRTSVEFFAILMRILARGKRRPVGDTPRVWVSRVLAQWQNRGHPLPHATIDELVDQYYHTVYGGHRPTPDERLAIQKSIDEVRQAVRRKS